MNLNVKQHEAVTHRDGPLLVVAGAGTGKTRVITHRIAHLISQGIPAREILAVTFTNKAASEMRERVMKLMETEVRPPTDGGLTSGEGGLPFVGTFHSLGVHILRESGRAVGVGKWFAILDRDDSKKIVRDALKECDYDPKQFEPGGVLSAISRSKGDMISRTDYTSEQELSYYGEVVARVWERYERELVKQSALDFDDLLVKTVGLLSNYPDVRKRYQSDWKYIHVDEYQDTNKVQYEMIKLLASEHMNVCAVGDTDQCFPSGTLIETPTGRKRIENIKIGQKITVAAGRGETTTGIVNKVHRRIQNGNLVKIILANGKKIAMTPEHIVFGRLPEKSQRFYVYLMYRKDRGYRIGIAKGSRSPGKDKPERHGLLVRSTQEHADRIWVLRVCDTRKEVIYWEQWYAWTYGIPLLLFHGIGRFLSFSEENIRKFYKNIDTETRAKILMNDLGLIFEYPHYIPKGKTSTNTERNRTKLNLVLFSDRRRSVLHPWGLSRLSINTTDIELRDLLNQSGFKSRKGKRKDWRLEVTNLDYAKIENLAKKIKIFAPNLDVGRTALLTKTGSFRQIPAAGLVPGLEVAIKTKKGVEVSCVKKMELSTHKGNVYDLDVASVHNYIANSMVVHNCIYAWRGASIENLMGFEKDFPGAKVVLLEENYRSTSNILDAANNIISKNENRKEKSLFTSLGTGEKINIYEALDPIEEAHFITSIIKKLKNVKLEEIAVLYRANFQSRILEEAFLNANIPYTVLGTRFYERMEVKDILAYVKCALNLNNKSSFARAVASPRRGIGDKTLENYFSNGEASEKISNFLNLLSDFKNKLESLPLPDALRYIARASGYEEMLKKSEEQERLENIQELVNLAGKYKSLPNEEALEKFLTDAGLASDQDTLMIEHDLSNNSKQVKKKGVRLMTVHAAKGLEFEHVFIVGLEQDLFPHRPMDDDWSKDKFEEERRLFYVALTRAKKCVYLSWCQTRQMYGETRVGLQSEYISDIPKELIESASEIEHLESFKIRPRGPKSGYLPDIEEIE